MRNIIIRGEASATKEVRGVLGNPQNNSPSRFGDNAESASKIEAAAAQMRNQQRWKKRIQEEQDQRMAPENFNRKTSNFIAQLKNKAITETQKAPRLCSTKDKLEDFGDGKSVKEKLILTALEQMVTQLDDRITVSKALEQNKYIWAKAMFRTKPLQELISAFSNQVCVLMKKEMEKDPIKLESYMKLTRAPDKSLASAKQYIAAILGEEKAAQKSQRKQQQKDDLDEHKCPNHGEDEVAVDLNAPINYYSLAKLVKGTNSLFSLVQDHLVPNDVDPNQKPTTQWIQRLCESRELLTFSHKKNALEEIKNTIDEEIARKKMLTELATNLANINNYVAHLDKQTDVFASRNENVERLEQDRLITKYKLLLKVDPFEAEQLIYPKAISYMQSWSDEPVGDHLGTLRGWKGTWDTNEHFEHEIMAETKWYKLDMLCLKRLSKRILDNQKEKCQFYMEAMETALNDHKLRTQQEIERLQMRLADIEAEALRADVQEDQIKNNFIEQFIYSKPKFGNLKEANKYMELLRDAVRNQYHVSKNLKREYEQLKSDHSFVEGRLNNLQDENEAKSKYCEWINEAVAIGSTSSLPKMYLKSEDKKRVEVFIREGMHKQQLAILEEAKVKEMLIEDIGMSKVFSILVSKLQDMATSIGLLTAKPETIKQYGAKKFKFNDEHLVDLYYMLKTPVVEKYFVLLNKYAADLRKFKKQYSEEPVEKIASKVEAAVDEASILEDRFKKLSKADKKIKEARVVQIAKHLDISPSTFEGMMRYDNAFAFANHINEVMIKETVSENEQEEKQRALQSSKQRIHDLVLVRDDRLVIDSKRFCVYLDDLGKQLEFNEDASGIDEMYSEIGQMFQSVLAANRLLAGKLSPDKGYLKEVHPKDLIDQEVQAGVKARIMTPNEIESEGAINKLEKQMNHAQLIIAEMENQFALLGINITAADIENALRLNVSGQPLQQSLSKTAVLDAANPKMNRSDFKDSFLQDLAKISEAIAKTLDLAEADPGRNQITAQVQEDIKNEEVFSIDLKSIDFGDLLTKTKGEFGTERLSLFSEESVGDVLLDLIYFKFQQAKDLQTGADAALRKRPRGFAEYRNYEAQTEIEFNEIQLMVEAKTRADERAANQVDANTSVVSHLALAPTSGPSKANIDDILAADQAMANDDLLMQIQIKNKKNEMLFDELGIRDPSSILRNNAGSAGNTERNGSQDEMKKMLGYMDKDSKLKGDQSQGKYGNGDLEDDLNALKNFSPDLYLHEVYKKMNMEKMLQDQGFAMFPPQRPLKLELYNQVKTKLDFIDDKSRKLRYFEDLEAVNNDTKTPKRSAQTRAGIAPFDFKDLERYYKLERGSVTKTIMSNRQLLRSPVPSEAAAQTHRARAQSSVCVNRDKFQKRQLELIKMKEKAARYQAQGKSGSKPRNEHRPKKRFSQASVVNSPSEALRLKRNSQVLLAKRTKITVNMTNQSKFRPFLRRSSANSQRSQNSQMDPNPEDRNANSGQAAEVRIIELKSPFDSRHDAFENKMRTIGYQASGLENGSQMMQNAGGILDSDKDTAESRKMVEILSINDNRNRQAMKAKRMSSQISSKFNSQASKKSLRSNQSSNVKIVIYKNARSSKNFQQQPSIEKLDPSDDGNSYQHQNDDMATTLLDQKSKDAMGEFSRHDAGMDHLTDALSHGNATEGDGFAKLKLNNPISQNTIDTNLTFPVHRIMASPSAAEDRRLFTRYRNDEFSQQQTSLSPILKRSDVVSGPDPNKIAKIKPGNEHGIRKVRHMIQSAQARNNGINSRQVPMKNVQTDASQQTGQGGFGGGKGSDNQIGSSFVRQKYYQMQVGKLDQVSSNQSARAAASGRRESQIRMLSAQNIANINKKAHRRTKWNPLEMTDVGSAFANLTSNRSQPNGQGAPAKPKPRAVSTKAVGFRPGSEAAPNQNSEAGVADRIERENQLFFSRQASHF